MELLQQGDSIGHVILGGHQAKAVQVSLDAGFMQILSSSLYKNQFLAVVRETITNAHDAHVAAGKTDIPIEITLNPETLSLSIRDFGSGIPTDIDTFIDIYGTYGGSTKRKDKAQTGSQGLGCKSPWSYTEVFNVTSYRDGLMSVFALSRNSAETGGNHSIKPLVYQIPSNESGLLVQIPVQREDIKKFENLIIAVVYAGGINATLNGKQLTTVDYSKATGGWMIDFNQKKLTTATAEASPHTNVYVKYGAMIYPVDSRFEYADYINTFYKTLSQCNPQFTPPALILIAKENTLVHQPSREALSYTEATIEALKALMAPLHKQFVKAEKYQVNARIKSEISKSIQATGSFPEKLEVKLDPITSIRKLNKLKYVYLYNRTDLRVASFSAKLVRKQEILYETKNKRNARLALKAYKTSWFDAAYKPIVKKIYKANLKADKLYSVNGVAIKKVLKMDDYFSWHAPLHLFLSSPALPQKKVVLVRGASHTAKALNELNLKGCVLAYVTGVKKSDIQNALDFFKKYGYEIYDHTAQPAKSASKTTTRQKRDKIEDIGYLRADVRPEDARGEVCKKGDHVRIFNPVFYITTKDALSVDERQLFGHLGAWFSKGAINKTTLPHYSVWLKDRLKKELSTNKRLQTYYLLDNYGHTEKRLLNMILHPKQKITERDTLLYNVSRYNSQREYAYRYVHNAAYKFPANIKHAIETISKFKELFSAWSYASPSTRKLLNHLLSYKD